MDPVDADRSNVAVAAPRVETLEQADVNLIGRPRWDDVEIPVNTAPYRRVVQLTWLIAGLVDVILALDFLFRTLNTHDQGFAGFIYSVGAVLGAPFDGIFGNTVNLSQNAVIGIDRWGDLMAIAIYTLIAAGVAQLARITLTPKDIESSSTTVV